MASLYEWLFNAASEVGKLTGKFLPAWNRIELVHPVFQVGPIELAAFAHHNSHSIVKITWPTRKQLVDDEVLCGGKRDKDSPNFDPL
jgi:hypothetical protein